MGTTGKTIDVIPKVPRSSHYPPPPGENLLKTDIISKMNLELFKLRYCHYFTGKFEVNLNMYCYYFTSDNSVIFELVTYFTG